MKDNDTMKHSMEQAEIMALFFRSYFLYTDIASKHGLSEDDRLRIRGYRMLMRILGHYSKEKHIRSAVLLDALAALLDHSEGTLCEVIEESIHFIESRLQSGYPPEKQPLLIKYA